MALSAHDYATAYAVIKDHQRILVLPHANVDPDGLSSALACYELLRSLGKDVTVICPDTPPESLEFLPGYERLERELTESQNFIITVNLQDGVEVDKLRYTVEDRKVNIIVVPKKGRISSEHISLGEGERRYDLILVVDTADLSLLGSLYTDHVDLFSELPVLNIDHHISNVRFGQAQLIDPTAASATEVLYGLFMSNPEWRNAITPDIATLLLTGLITDTRSFQNPNTTPRSLEIAAELLEKGARQQEIIQHIYKTKPLSTLRIWGRALNRIQMDRDSGVVWSAISKEDLQELDAKSKETHGILDELISTIPEGRVYALFTELEEGGLKASLRSDTSVDVNKLAGELYGGGGHARAAGFRIRQFSNFQLQVLECVQRFKEGIRRQLEAQVANERAQEETRETEPMAPSKEPQPIERSDKTVKTESAKQATAKPDTKSDPESNKKGTDIVKTLGAGNGPPGETDIMADLTGEET
jgi:nanoRNase/pAp phosphatase (c-di-AMP/oligoRNAs hydrolase)